jgi:hypothetical protein
MSNEAARLLSAITSPTRASDDDGVCSTDNELPATEMGDADEDSRDSDMTSLTASVPALGLARVPVLGTGIFSAKQEQALEIRELPEEHPSEKSDTPE